jgi:hypothetical protein
MSFIMHVKKSERGLQMRRILVLFLVVTFIIFSVANFYGQDNECDECKTNPANCCDEFPGICNPPPGNDNADDSMSISSFISNPSLISTGKGTAAVLNRGYWQAAEKLFGNFSDNINLVEITGDSWPDFVVLPSGALFGKRNDTTFKYALEQYVSRGGTILCFVQQDAGDYSVIPVPEGSQLQAEGWRNIQSCLYGSIYFNPGDMHPVLSGQTSQRISAGVDGGFNILPGGTKVLIRRTVNNQPALVEYSYGDKNGRIILSATYSDWNYAKGYASTSELKLIRDLVTYCKSNLPIPLFNLELDPNPVINLNIKVRNVTEIPAALAKLTAYDPDRIRILYENQVSISLNPGEDVEVPIQFTLPQMSSSEMGIAHVDYELYDSENNLILPAVESDSGRFAIYSTSTPYVPKEQCQYWLTVDNEEVSFDDPVSFVLHARNYTDTEKQVEFKFQWDHLAIQPLTTLTLPPGETVEYAFEKEAKGSMFWVYPAGAVKFGKGFRLTRPKTRSYIILNHFWGIKAGMPISYKCEINNSLDKDMDCNIKLSLLDSNESLLEVLYNEIHHLAAGGTYEFSDTHPMPDIEVPGKCWLKLEVERPDGTKETQKTYVSYFQPHVQLSYPVLDIPGGSGPGKLIPGVTYPVHMTLYNAVDDYMLNHPSLQFGVDNGKLVFAFENEQGVEAGKAEIDGIHIYFSEVKEFSTAITFTPPQPDVYRLKVYYQDETRPTPIACNYVTRYQSIETKSRVGLDKPVYWYLDTANLTVKLTGVGNYLVKLNCPELNFNEQRTVPVRQWFQLNYLYHYLERSSHGL